MFATTLSVAGRHGVLRVLLIEPSVDDAARVRTLLANQPEFRVSVARSLPEARTLLIDGAFDVALVEAALWSTEGTGLLDVMRQRRPDVAVVVMTSGHNEREALPALKLGAHDFVSKRNLEGDQLGARILAAVEESRSMRRRDTMTRWLEREARTDHLTGFYNRRAFDERLHEVCAGARAAGGTVALVLANVVGTGQVNEAHGYDVGDLLIRRAARGIARCTRAVDFVARVGGDDFGIIISDGDLELGRRIARRIAHEIERLNIEEWFDQVPVSMVFGVASGLAPDADELFFAAEQQITNTHGGRPEISYFPERDEPDGPSVA